MTTENNTQIQAITQKITILETAWNAHDAERFASVFTEDGDFINFMGGWLQGRAEIQAAHGQIFTTVMQKSLMSITDIQTKFIKSDVAIVHAVWILDGQMTPDGKDVPQRKGRLTIVIIESDGNWQIVALQNTEIAPIPPAKP